MLNLIQVDTRRYKGDNWIVTEGLKPGDIVVESGFQKLREGSYVSFKEPDSSVKTESNEKEK